MASIQTRMGDSYSVEMTPEEVREDLLAGSADAARRGKIAPQPRPSLTRRTRRYFIHLSV